MGPADHPHSLFQRLPKHPTHFPQTKTNIENAMTQILHALHPCRILRKLPPHLGLAPPMTPSPILQPWPPITTPCISPYPQAYMQSPDRLPRRSHPLSWTQERTSPWPRELQKNQATDWRGVYQRPSHPAPVRSEGAGVVLRCAECLVWEKAWRWGAWWDPTGWNGCGKMYILRCGLMWLLSFTLYAWWFFILP